MPINPIILACDPGYDRLGIACMSGSVHAPELIFSTCLTTNKSDPMEKRLASLFADIEDIYAQHSPTVLALETLFFKQTNAKTALAVAGVRGMLLTFAGLRNMQVIEHSPQQIKLAVTGYGASQKEEVMRMTRRLIPNISAAALDDEYDAVALSICALASYKK